MMFLTAKYELDPDFLEKVRKLRPTKENPLILLVQADMEAHDGEMIMDGLAAMMEAVKAEAVEGFKIVVFPSNLKLTELTDETLEAMGLQRKPGVPVEGLAGILDEDNDCDDEEDSDVPHETCSFCNTKIKEIEACLFFADGRWMCQKCIDKQVLFLGLGGLPEDTIAKRIEAYFSKGES